MCPDKVENTPTKSNKRVDQEATWRIAVTFWCDCGRKGTEYATYHEENIGKISDDLSNFPYHIKKVVIDRIVEDGNRGKPSIDFRGEGLKYRDFSSRR